jgi:hypothetical protein
MFPVPYGGIACAQVGLCVCVCVCVCVWVGGCVCVCPSGVSDCVG